MMRASQHGGRVPDSVDKFHVAKHEGVESWTRGPFDTREEAIAEGRALFGDDGFVIGVGAECHVSAPDANDVLERCGEDAFEQCGDVGDDFLCHVPPEAVEALEHKLVSLFGQWLTDNDLWPQFCKIENIERIGPEGT